MFTESGLSFPHAHSALEAAGNQFVVLSERIISIRVKVHYGFATIIAVYALTNPRSATQEAKSASEIFYNQLQSAVASIPDCDMIVVMGDFNARVGSDFNQWGSDVGPHRPSECNENGERLLDFCACNNLIVTYTWFQHKPIHQLTWFRNRNRSLPGHLIDHVLVNRRFRSSVLDTRVYQSVYLESDHELVVSTLRFKIKARRCQHSGRPQHQTQSLPCEVKTALTSTMSDALSSLVGTNPGPSILESTWNSFKVAMQQHASPYRWFPRAPRKTG